MPWKPPFFVSVKGNPYAKHHRMSAMLALVACDGKIDMDAANAARASPRTLFRWAERLKTEGHFRPRKHSGGPERKMDEDDALFLWCWTMAFPAVMRDELRSAARVSRNCSHDPTAPCSCLNCSLPSCCCRGSATGAAFSCLTMPAPLPL